MALLELAPFPDFVTKAELYDNEIFNCGVYDFIFNEGGYNGEGICEFSTKEHELREICATADVCFIKVLYDGLSPVFALFSYVSS